MSSKTPLKAFECPSCGAPLEVREGAKNVKCHYCNMTVSIPQDPEPIVIEIPVDRPARIPKTRNEEERRKQEQFVVVFSLGVVFVLFFLWRFVSNAVETPPPTEVFVYHSPVPTNTPLPPYAKHLLTFSTDINPSSSKMLNSSDIDIDEDGNLLVTEYISDSSIVYKFDPEGGFLSTQFDTDYNITSFSMGPDGGMITAFGFDVHLYINGSEALVLRDQYARDVVFGKDGSFYVVGFDNTLTRYVQNGTVDLQIDKVFETHLNSPEIAAHLAVDSSGNMYLLGSSNAVVFKFSPDGNLLDSYNGNTTGLFGYPQSIAVDSLDRVFISNFENILVFDGNFKYIDRFSTVDKLNVQSIAIDHENHLYALTDENTVEKFELPTPSQ